MSAFSYKLNQPHSAEHHEHIHIGDHLVPIDGVRGGVGSSNVAVTQWPSSLYVYIYI